MVHLALKYQSFQLVYTIVWRKAEVKNISINHHQNQSENPWLTFYEFSCEWILFFKIFFWLRGFSHGRHLNMFTITVVHHFLKRYLSSFAPCDDKSCDELMWKEVVEKWFSVAVISAVEMKVEEIFCTKIAKRDRKVQW